MDREFEIIRRIAKKPKSKHVVSGIGDDAAVIDIGKRYLLLTTDSQVEGIHFKKEWFTAEQVGIKAAESNISDILSMNGTPCHAMVSLILPKETEKRFVIEMYRGIRKSFSRYHCDIVGGNISEGKTFSVTISLTGYAKKESIKMRSGARNGDFIVINGYPGESLAGFMLLKKGIKGYDKIKKGHLEPHAYPVDVKSLPFINAMIDTSDGIIGDLRHICDESRCGAILYKGKLPISNNVAKAGELLGENPYDLAISGGEDYRMLCTVPGKHISKVKGFVIGEITRKRCIKVIGGSAPRSYEHFQK